MDRNSRTSLGHGVRESLAGISALASDSDDGDRGGPGGSDGAVEDSIVVRHGASDKI